VHQLRTVLKPTAPNTRFTRKENSLPIGRGCEGKLDNLTKHRFIQKQRKTCDYTRTRRS